MESFEVVTRNERAGVRHQQLVSPARSVRVTTCGKGVSAVIFDSPV